MLTFLKTAAAIAVILSIVPLFIWGATGSLRQAWEALKGYLLVMAILTAPGLLAAAVTLLPRLF